jgi:hypothetical protein
MNQTQTVKNNTPSRRYARRWFGRGYTMEPDSLFRRLAGSLSGILPWLALLPLAALSQANYATPYTFTTIAGKVGIIGSADGTGSAARFSYPISVAVDTNGNVYVADCGNSTIRKMTPLGTRWVVTTMAGKAGVTGSADGTGSAARFNEPYRVAVDSAGNLYVADFNNCTIRKVVPVGTNWVVTTLAGRAETPGAADGTGSAARFYGPTSVAVDSAGNVYVADVYNNAIRKVTPVGTNWVVTTLAGSGGVAGSADGTGTAAQFNGPNDVAVDTAGNPYVADFNNCTIRRGFAASSVPAPILQPPSLSAGQFGFGITGLPGLAVNIEASTDLSQWQVLSPYITLVGGTNYYVNPSPSQSAQFYRAKVR